MLRPALNSELRRWIQAEKSPEPGGHAFVRYRQHLPEPSWAQTNCVTIHYWWAQQASRRAWLARGNGSLWTVSRTEDLTYPNRIAS